MSIDFRFARIVSPQLCAIIILFAVGVAVFAQGVPQQMNYQGRLLDPITSNPITQPQKIEFNILDQSVNGTVVWGPQTFDNVSMTAQGEFNVILGPADASSRSLSQAFGGPNRFLSIKIGPAGGAVGANELTPRQQILSAPFAMKSAYPPGWLYGGVISNGANAQALNITAVDCRSEDNRSDISVAAMTKTAVAWQQGTNNGAGSIANGMAYIWAIGDSTGVSPGDFVFSESFAAPTMPSGYDRRRLIGARYFEGGWRAHRTTGTGVDKWVYYDSPPYALNQSVNPGTWTSTGTIPYVPQRISKTVLVCGKVAVTNWNVGLAVRTGGSTGSEQWIGITYAAAGSGNITITGGRAQLDVNASRALDVLVEMTASTGNTALVLSAYQENL